MNNGDVEEGHGAARVDDSGGNRLRPSPSALVTVRAGDPQELTSGSRPVSANAANAFESRLTDAHVLDALAEAIVCIDAAGTIVGAWGACFEIFGNHTDDLIGTNAFDRVHPDDVAYGAGALLEAIGRSGDHIPINLRISTTEGRWVLIEAAAGSLHQPALMLISLRPLTYRGHMDERRADLQQRCLQIASTVATAHGAQLEHTLCAAVESVNEFFHTAAVTFCGSGTPCIRTGESIDWPEPTALTAGTYRDHGRCNNHSVLEVHVSAESDARWWLAWKERDPGLAGWDGSHLDDLALAGAVIASAQARLRLEADLVRRSREDALTGLANRRELQASLRRILAHGSATVLFCDLDGFKHVNDAFGHAFGDRVLQVVAKRFRCALRPGDVIARFGGDEFVAACPSLPLGQQAAMLDRLRDALTEPIRVDGLDVSVGVSVGAARGHAGADAAKLIARADASMYHAKRSSTPL